MVIALGTLIGCASTGLVPGPIVGGALGLHASWRWCKCHHIVPSFYIYPLFAAGFYLSLPIDAITLTLLAATRIPDAKVKVEVPHSIHERLDRLDLPAAPFSHQR
jgi:MFS family permease